MRYFTIKRVNVFVMISNLSLQQLASRSAPEDQLWRFDVDCDARATHAVQRRLDRTARDTAGRTSRGDVVHAQLRAGAALRRAERRRAQRDLLDRRRARSAASRARRVHAAPVVGARRAVARLGCARRARRRRRPVAHRCPCPDQDDAHARRRRVKDSGSPLDGCADIDDNDVDMN